MTFVNLFLKNIVINIYTPQFYHYKELYIVNTIQIIIEKKNLKL
jgi:hypothetical protein